jgi:5,6-dimethylbenzimidazole synthase
VSLVVGIGLRAGTSYRELRDLVAGALADLEPREVSCVVTVEGRESEPGLQRLVASLGAELLTAPALDLSKQPAPTPSTHVDHLAGTASVAEAGVILSGAELLVPKQRSVRATVAIGRLPQVEKASARHEVGDAGPGIGQAEAESTGCVVEQMVAPGYAVGERDTVHRVLAERRDVRRGFLDRPIADDVLTRVLESAHRAPSVGLSQPWDFVLVRDVATRRKVHDLAVAQRDVFAASLPADRRFAFDGLKIEAILDTPLNIAVTCDPGRGGRHVLGRHADPRTTWFSAAIAIQNLWLAARAEGLGVGWVSFFEPGEVAGVLDLPAHVELVGYLCVGHVQKFAAAPELVRTGWAARRPLSWAVHQEAWGRRGLPGEEPGPAVAVQAAAAGEELATSLKRPAAGDDGRLATSLERPGAGGDGGLAARATQVVWVVVVEGGDVSKYLRRAEALVVVVGGEKPAADFGVLWRPARTADEAVELGVEVARDLVLQGVGELVVECPRPSELTEGFARGIRLGGLACGVAVKGLDEPAGVTDSTA